MSSKAKRHGREPSDPTPEQIDARAAEVRKRWTKRVINKRTTCRQPGWMPPLVMTVELVREINAREQ